MKRGNRALLRAVALGQILLLVMAGCKSSSDNASRAVVVNQALDGKDGEVTVTDPNTIVNGYSALTAATAVGVIPATVTVSSLGDFTADTTSPGTRPALAAGDLVLIIQMTGATINETAGDPNNPGYGNVTDYGSAGHYELAGVTSIDAATNKITLGCSLQKTYTVAGKTQVIRVPQYKTLTIPDTRSIIAPPWDGAKGGVVALQVATTLTINGTTGKIDASEKGFRGGTTHAGAGSSALDIHTTYRSTDPNDGAEKGESIAGWPQDAGFAYRYGRGAPANGGGGGNWHNGGGGGGANAAASGVGSDAGGPNWNGQGVMLSSVLGAAAWTKDPGYAMSGGPGGGRGGYTYSALNGDALADPPGDAVSWGGNSRRERGGLGGHPLTSSPSGANARLFLGGGGGAGDGNNLTGGNLIAGPGGRGGGLVFVIADNVTGTGSILANGANGGNANSNGSTSGDGPGGGGGGGTVVVHAGTLGTDIKVGANGGVGGNQTNINSNIEAEGPGGGGGGGYIALSGGIPTSVTADGGGGGTTIASATYTSSVAEFPSNGATAGQKGLIEDTAGSSMFYCTNPIATITPTNVATGAFTFGSDQSGVTIECKLDTGAYGTCLANYTVGDGDHTIYAHATDINGNVGPTVEYAWHAGELDGGIDAEAEEAGAPDAVSLDVPPVLLDAETPGLDAGEGLDGIVLLLDAGEDTSPEDGAVVLLDAATSPADGPFVFLDAAGPKADVAPVDANAPPVKLDASEDGSDASGVEDASGDGNELEVSAQDAQPFVVVEPPFPSSSDASPAVDQAVVSSPDSAGTTVADAAVPGPDAGVPNPNVKTMGGGFCAVSPMHDSAPGLFTFFLLAAFGLLVLGRRRR
jgi:MYXO-CTERM domain-containing protein